MVNIVIIPIQNSGEATCHLAKTLNGKYGLNVVVVANPHSQMYFRQEGLQVALCNNFIEIEHQLLLNEFFFVIDCQETSIQNENFEVITLRDYKQVSSIPTGTTFPDKKINNNQFEWIFLNKNKARIQFSTFPSTTHDDLKPLLEYIYKNAMCHTAAVLNDDFVIFKTNRGNLSRLPINNSNGQLKNTVNIYPVCNWQSTHDLVNMWNKFCRIDKNGQKVHTTRHGNIRFVLDKNKADYFVVINQSYEPVDFQRTLYYAMEPHMDKTPSFMNFYNHLANNRPLFWGVHDYQVNNTEWHLSPTIDQFLNNSVNLEKKFPRTLSVIISEKNYDEGHKLRLAFVKELDTRQKEGRLPFSIHIYGSNSMNFHNYKGSLPPNKKDDGIFPYEYHFNAENNAIKNYITEKFTDAILGESLMFYWGCPNIEDYYSPDCYIRLTLKQENWDEEIKMIGDMMDTNTYNTRLPVIKQMKEIILKRYNMFARFKTNIDLVKIQVFYRLEKESMDATLVDKENGEVLKNSGFNTIHFFNFKGFETFSEAQKTNSYMELFREILNRNCDCLLYPRTSEISPQDLYRKLSMTVTHYREMTEEDVDIIQLTEEGGKDPIVTGFYIRQESVEKVIMKWSELMRKVPNANVALRQMFNGFVVKNLLK